MHKVWVLCSFPWRRQETWSLDHRTINKNRSSGNKLIISLIEKKERRKRKNKKGIKRKWCWVLSWKWWTKLARRRDF